MKHWDDVDEGLMDKVRDWYDWLRSRAILKNTLDSYSMQLKFFMDFLFLRNCEVVSMESMLKIDVYECRAWLSSLYSRGLKSSSVAVGLSAVRSFFSYLCLHGCCTNSVFDRISNPSSSKQAIHVVECIDILSMIDGISNQNLVVDWVKKRDCAIVYLIYGCALRISEVLSIRVNEWNDKALRVEGKGGRHRMVPVLQVVADAVQDYIDACPYITSVFGNSNHLFVGVRGRVLLRNYVAFLFKKFRQTFCLSDFVKPHNLRRTCASHLLSNGADIRDIQELLGHSDLATTQLYADVNHDLLKKVYSDCMPKFGDDS